LTKLCILAGNKDEAKRWASTQNLEDSQWFFPDSPNELLFKSNFHVIVVGTAGENVPSYFFEQIYSLAMKRGRIGRE